MKISYGKEIFMMSTQDLRLSFYKKKAEHQRKRIQEQKLRLEIAQLNKEIATLEQSRRRVYNETRVTRQSDRPSPQKRKSYWNGNR